MNSSTGAITFYRLSIIEVDCATGQLPINILYQGNLIPTNNPGTIGLNSLEIDGATGHFANSPDAWVNRCLRIEAEVGNNCGSTTDFTYFQFDGVYFNDPNGDSRFSDEENDFTNDFNINIYPNPVREELNITLSGAVKQYPINVTVFNSSGQAIESISLSSESNQYTINTNNLDSGVYFYQVSVDGMIKSGKFSKVK